VYLASVGNPRLEKPFDPVALKKIVQEQVVAAKSGS
jgi:hypothetical protein